MISEELAVRVRTMRKHLFSSLREKVEGERERQTVKKRREIERAVLSHWMWVKNMLTLYPKGYGCPLFSAVPFLMLPLRIKCIS